MWCVTWVEFNMLDHPCIPGINPTWQWCMIFSVCCWILCADIPLRTFASLFIGDVGLWFSCGGSGMILEHAPHGLSGVPSGTQFHVLKVVSLSLMHPLLACLISLSHSLVSSLVLLGVTSLINYFLSSPHIISALRGTKTRRIQAGV